MFKLHFVFLKKFIALFIFIFISFGVIAYVWLTNLYIDEVKKDIKNNINIIEIFLQKENNLDNLVTAVKEKTDYRITIIDNNGIVIAESNKDKKLLDNHKNRDEILQAQKYVFGNSIRYSYTLQKDLLYVAKRIIFQKRIIFIRMASTLDRINNYFYNFAFKISLVIILFFTFAIYIAIRVSKEIENETKKILQFLNKLAKQKKAHHITSHYSIEFYKITKVLTKVSQILAKKDKQKSKYTAKLKLSNRQKDDIISAISHEFKNPIAVISGYAQTLAEEQDIHPKIAKNFLAKISSNTQKLTNMIDRLRLSIRLQSNKQTLVLKKIKLQTIVSSIVEDLKITYPNREIKIELQQQDIAIVVDETLLNIAITNLIENALKYSKDIVLISLDKNHISIKDKGIGIPQKELLNITDKFYRVSSNSWNNSLGVGLALVKSIVQIHNFKLEIYSKENEGSTFKIILKV